jgi:hypothetical protein
MLIKKKKKNFIIQGACEPDFNNKFLFYHYENSGE